MYVWLVLLCLDKFSPFHCLNRWQTDRPYVSLKYLIQFVWVLLLLCFKVIAPAHLFVCECSPDALHYVPLPHMFHRLQRARERPPITERKKKKKKKNLYAATIRGWCIFKNGSVVFFWPLRFIFIFPPLLKAHILYITHCTSDMHTFENINIICSLKKLQNMIPLQNLLFLLGTCPPCLSVLVPHSMLTGCVRQKITLPSWSDIYQRWRNSWLQPSICFSLIRSGAQWCLDETPLRNLYYIMSQLYVFRCVCMCARAATCTCNNQVSARATSVLLSNGVTISVSALSPR